MSQEKHATVVIGMVDGVDAMKKQRNEAVRNLAAAVKEANVFRECLEGKFGMSGDGGGASKSKAAASKSKLCAPCNKVYNMKLDLIKKNHADELGKLQLSVKHWTVKYDAKLEAHAFSHRFRDRENELRQRVEVLEHELCRVKVELREKKANFDTHMVSTLKHKAIAKEIVAVKEHFELAKSRVAELEKSVLQVMCVAVAVVVDFTDQHFPGFGCRRPLQKAPHPNASRQALPCHFSREGDPACCRTRRRAAPSACGRLVRGRPPLRLPLPAR